jgi:hypothetical protein
MTAVHKASYPYLLYLGNIMDNAYFTRPLDMAYSEFIRARQHLLVHGKKVLSQKFSNFSRSRAQFTLAYRLSGHKLINEDNLLKLHINLLKMLTSYSKYYYK